jgi:hypothetical protein
LCTAVWAIPARCNASVTFGSSSSVTTRSPITIVVPSAYLLNTA